MTTSHDWRNPAKKRNLARRLSPWGDRRSPDRSIACKPGDAAPVRPQSAHAADAPGVAFVYLGNPGDAGWTFAHDQGSKEAEAKFGNKIKITRIENVPESADSERVFRDLANKGNKVIIGSSFGYQDFELKVAKDFPDTVFLHATGYKKAPNFGTYDVRMYQGAYLGRRRRGLCDEDQHARLRRVGADSRSGPQHQRVHARRALGESEGAYEGHLDQ